VLSVLSVMQQYKLYLEAVIYCCPNPRLYHEYQRDNPLSPVGGGLEYQTTNRVLSARGYNWDTLFLGDINTGTWLIRLGESQIRQADMVMCSAGLWTRE
jgi:hypothetical protein